MKRAFKMKEKAFLIFIRAFTEKQINTCFWKVNV